MTWRKWTMVHTMLRWGSVIHLGGLHERLHSGCNGHALRASSHVGRCSKRHYPFFGKETFVQAFAPISAIHSASDYTSSRTWALALYACFDRIRKIGVNSLTDSRILSINCHC
jgi:hypothetical protein